MGIGVKALSRIRKGSLITEVKSDYKGSRKGSREVAIVMMKKQKPVKAFSALWTYVNHSCEPNATMQRWEVDGVERLALVSLTDINTSDPVTIHYNNSEGSRNENIE